MTLAKSPTERFGTLALRRGISLGVLYSSNRNDFALVLAAAASEFQEGNTYSEREVNDILLAWLGGAGAMLAVDHVELRRWLVDNRLLDRDGFGRAYTRGQPAPELAGLVAALAGHDLNAVAQAARTRDAAARAERKQQWAASRGSTGDVSALRNG